jgi:rsbT antagonist protein RsbS
MRRAVPIIRLHDSLIVSIQIELSDGLVLALKDDLAQEIRRSEVKGLIIEVSGVDVLDSFIARSIRDMAEIAKLMGVRTVLAGLDAAMAMTLVEMGMTMAGVVTALNMEAALQLLRTRPEEDYAADVTALAESEILAPLD